MSDTINNFYNCINTAHKLRENAKVYKASKDFLSELYKTDKSHLIFLKRLAGYYSVARTMTTSSDKQKKLVEYIEKKKITRFEYNKSLIKFISVNGYAASKEKDKMVVSLISKYLYYSTGYQFPIFDGLANRNMEKLWKKLIQNHIIKKTKEPVPYHDKFFYRYDKIIEIFKDKKDPDLISKIDAFLWLYGILDGAVEKSKKEGMSKELFGDLMFYSPMGYGIDKLKEYREWYKSVRKFLDEPENNK